MGVVGIAKRGFGRALTHVKNLSRARKIDKGKRYKTIKSVKPMSGKIPPYIGAGGKSPEKRAAIVKTHFSLQRSNKIDKAVKDIKEGKKTLKDLVDTKQAEELKDYKGKGTGIFHKTGFKD